MGDSDCEAADAGRSASLAKHVPQASAFPDTRRARAPLRLPQERAAVAMAPVQFGQPFPPPARRHDAASHGGRLCRVVGAVLHVRRACEAEMSNGRKCRSCGGGEAQASALVDRWRRPGSSPSCPPFSLRPHLAAPTVHCMSVGFTCSGCPSRALARATRESRPSCPCMIHRHALPKCPLLMAHDLLNSHPLSCALGCRLGECPARDGKMGDIASLARRSLRGWHSQLALAGPYRVALAPRWRCISDSRELSPQQASQGHVAV